MSARPRGYIDWRPRTQDQKDRLDLAHIVIVESQDYWPLSIRTVFYGMLDYGYPKTDREYQNLVECLNKARRAGLVPWETITDGGFMAGGFTGWSSYQAALDHIVSLGENYRRNLLAGQTPIVLWCEAQGMVPRLQHSCAPYSVPVMSSGGFDSVSAKREFAVQHARSGVVLLHVGDYDPSGVHVHQALVEDIAAFMLTDRLVEERLAVLPEQIEELGLQTAPPKRNDRRKFDDHRTVQAEAIKPPDMHRIVTDAIERHLDRELFDAVQAEEVEERAVLLPQLEAVA